MKERFVTIKLPNGEIWGVPIDVIAQNHAQYYAEKEYNGDVKKCMELDTMPLFSDDYEILDWASGNMNWSDVKDYMVKLTDEDPNWHEQQKEKAWLTKTKITQVSTKHTC